MNEKTNTTSWGAVAPRAGAGARVAASIQPINGSKRRRLAPQVLPPLGRLSAEVATLDTARQPDGPEAETHSATLREATFRGVRWVAGARIAAEVLAFAGAVALARLIAPAEFGRAAVALALVPLAVILTFEGCASALVQRPEITRAHVQGAMLLSLVTGIAADRDRDRLRQRARGRRSSARAPAS